MTGFTAAGIGVTNSGTVSGVHAGGRSSHTRFIVIPTMQGTVSVSVAAGAAIDASGNCERRFHARFCCTFCRLDRAPAVTVQCADDEQLDSPTITGTVDDPAVAVSVFTVNCWHDAERNR